MRLPLQFTSNFFTACNDLVLTRLTTSVRDAREVDVVLCDALISAFQRIQSEARTRRNQVVPRLHVVLPAEILLLIMSSCLGSKPHPPTRTQWLPQNEFPWRKNRATLQLVCKRWKVTLDNRSQLWASIDNRLDVGSLPDILRKSKEQPLQITYSFEPRYQTLDVAHKHRMLFPHTLSPSAHRWRSLNIQTNDIPVVERFLALHMPNLDSIRLSCTSPLTGRVFSDPPPPIKTAIITSCRISLEQLGARLEVLWLHSVAMSPQETILMLAHMPVLMDLAIVDSDRPNHAPTGPYTDATPLQLPSLRKLTLDCLRVWFDRFLYAIAPVDLSDGLYLYRTFEDEISLKRLMGWIGDKVLGWEGRCLEFGDSQKGGLCVGGPFSLMVGTWSPSAETQQVDLWEEVVKELPLSIQNNVYTLNFDVVQPTLTGLRSLSTLLPNVTSIHSMYHGSNTVLRSFIIPDANLFPNIRVLELQARPAFGWSDKVAFYRPGWRAKVDGQEYGSLCPRTRQWIQQTRVDFTRVDGGGLLPIHDA